MCLGAGIQTQVEQETPGAHWLNSLVGKQTPDPLKSLSQNTRWQAGEMAQWVEALEQTHKAKAAGYGDSFAKRVCPAPAQASQHAARLLSMM